MHLTCILITTSSKCWLLREWKKSQHKHICYQLQHVHGLDTSSIRFRVILNWSRPNSFIISMLLTSKVTTLRAWQSLNQYRISPGQPTRYACRNEPLQRFITQGAITHVFPYGKWTTINWYELDHVMLKHTELSEYLTRTSSPSIQIAEFLHAYLHVTAEEKKRWKIS